MLTTAPASGVVNGNTAQLLGWDNFTLEMEIVCDGGCCSHTSPRTTTSSSTVGPGAAGSGGTQGRRTQQFIDGRGGLGLARLVHQCITLLPGRQPARGLTRRSCGLT